MNLANNLAQQVIVIGPVEGDALSEPITHPSVDKALQERVWKGFSL